MPELVDQTHSDPLKSMLRALGGDDSQFWQQIVDSMNEGLLLISPDKRIVYINRKAQELIGRSREDALGRPCTEAIRCPNCACCCLLFEDGEMEGVTVSIFDDHDQLARVILKSARLLYGENGQVIGGIETFKDITEEYTQSQQKERFTALLSEEKCRSEALLGSLREGVFSIDRDMHLTSFSLRMEELTGQKSEQVLGQDYRSLLVNQRSQLQTRSLEELDGLSCRVEIKTAWSKPLYAEMFFRHMQGKAGEILGSLRPLQMESPQSASSPADNFMGIVSRSSKMQQMFALLQSAGDSEASILIEGESGTGKELVARAIHNISSRRSEPFYAVNCATFTGSLLLSELFGHERGAFTGAYKTSKGKLELAGTGTLFLDEISEIPMQYQGLLLRVLEARQFERVGGQATLNMQARIISATNEKLDQAVRDGRFRQDLYYRLKVVPVRVPPLRERQQDIPVLANFFARHPGININNELIEFSPLAIQAMREYSWPGNVRELRNLIEYMCFVAKGEIQLEDLPIEIRKFKTSDPVLYSGSNLSKPLNNSPDQGESASLRAHLIASQQAHAMTEAPESFAQNKRDQIRLALEQAHYNKGQAAKILGIDRSTLWRKMKKLGID